MKTKRILLNQKFYILGFSLFVMGCSFFNKADNKDVIAKVNDNYLYKNDVKNIVQEGTSKEDSSLIIAAYINHWARHLLLMEGALINLSEDKQNHFSKLIEQYKKDLYTKAYLEALVEKNIDTIVQSKEAKVFYEANKASFKLNDNLLQFRYICMPLNPIDFDSIKKRFRRFNTKDKRYLDSISIQFKSYLLNDSLWVNLNQVIKKIPAITQQNKNELLKKSNFLQLKDSLNLYLVQVKNVCKQNEQAPLEYVSSSIKKIVINKRKLELIKQLENDIIKDAIKNNQFQIYN